MIKKVLIANRGEIVVRIARTCREMGIATVAVYSDVDRYALHVETCDEAYCIGTAPAVESYLNQERILDSAIRAGCDAIHPGYGFLSENAEFADRVSRSGLAWIGPRESAMRMMGSKTAARSLMSKVGVPVVPGSEAAVEMEEAIRFGETVGFPIVLKASAGGGGKGMRVVHSAEQIRSWFASVQREAMSAFGDAAVYVEKYIDKPRHVEIQIFADSHGNVIHLGERECSIQRRHQKIIEESPSVALTPELRTRMGETAINAAQACGYVNAGTIEFLLDASGSYYFLEMNTRLQVEHPVTENLTGLDLVRLQLMIADGAVLPITQSQVNLRGHSIEVRIYAEDASNGFLPSTGKLRRFFTPSGPGIRNDVGYRAGDEVSRFYDPMLGKLIVYGESREAALARTVRALEEYEIVGVRSSIPFCRHIIASPDFRDGHFHTQSADSILIQSYLAQESQPSESEEDLAAALAVALTSRNGVGEASGVLPDYSKSNWRPQGRINSLIGLQGG